MASEELRAVLTALEISIESEFVPWSRSMNAHDKMLSDTDRARRSLNWNVTIKKSGRPVMITEYMQGVAFCPSYVQGDESVHRAGLIEYETENGRAAPRFGLPGRELKPDILRVMGCLVSDLDVLDHPSFEEWANSFGYDTDSRKAERIYRVCLERAMRFRHAVGEDGVHKLREAAQDL